MSRILPTAVGVLLIVLGLALSAGGVQLVVLGGSFYYVVAGTVLVASGVLLFRRHICGAYVFSAFLVGTLLWSFAETGLAFWPLIPRVVMPLGLGILVALCVPALQPKGERAQLRARAGFLIASFLGLVLIGIGACAFHPSPIKGAGKLPAAPRESSVPGTEIAHKDTEWRHYGRTATGMRFSPADEISPENVRQLQVAWVYRWGDAERRTGEEQSTPLQVGSNLYFCTNRNVVIALDAESGQEHWRFDPHPAPAPLPRCRGVGYHVIREALQVLGLSCPRRILASTLDARLIALDASTGKPCPDFGDHGMVDLKAGMGRMEPGDYYQTSAPAVVRDLVIIGGRVEDGRRQDMPSGVVRAFSVISGELVWAWDPGNPAITGLPPEGHTYTRSSPNMWSTPVYDEPLGLLYVSLGVPTGANDFWGGWRTPELEKYANSVVALDIRTGRPRWHFQTVHHDLWDYDLASHPTLVDVPDGRDGTTPALIQSTKRGQIFLLDRRDGSAIAPIQEKPVPQGAAPGDWTSPTQPYSVGMPAVGTEPLTEASLWGITPIDQLWCRIRFKRRHYEGEFTPPSTTATLGFPGWFGGMNWGGVSVDERRGVLIVNDLRVPTEIRLVPHDEIARMKKDRGASAKTGHGPWLGERAGAFAASVRMFTSPLGIPCNAPPWGTMTAIDLASRKMLWQIPMGTARDSDALPVPISLPLGLPTLGGSLVTDSGLVFFAGTQDFYLRALDVRTGKELWKARLPIGAQATPMTYVSSESGRQFVVIVAGGAPLSKQKGDYVIAYTLPKVSRAH